MGHLSTFGCPAYWAVVKKLNKSYHCIKAKLRKIDDPGQVARTIASDMGLSRAKFSDRYLSRDGIPGGAVDVTGKINGIKVRVTWEREWDNLYVKEA